VEDETIELVLSAFSDIVTRIEKGRAGHNSLSSKGFIEFCEFWIALAKKGQSFKSLKADVLDILLQGEDIRLVDRVAALVQGYSTAHPSKLRSPHSEPVTALIGNIKELEDSCTLKKDWVALEAHCLCAVFAQMTTILEQWGSGLSLSSFRVVSATKKKRGRRDTTIERNLETPAKRATFTSATLESTK